MTTRREFDAIVIGAGLAGLTAAIRLQRAGLETVVLERQSKAGGLCGTAPINGVEFVYGCNDFGAGLAKELRELAVDAAFMHPRSRFYLGDTRVDLPPTLRTVGALLKRTPAIARALLGARRPDVESLGALIDGHIADPLVRDFTAILSCAVMRSPDDVSLSALAAVFDRRWGYGYDRVTTPVGGPQRMIDRMVERFEALGGQRVFGCVCEAPTRRRDVHSVRTTHGSFSARVLMSSVGRWSEFPENSRKGLEVSLLVFAVSPKVIYPRGYHTIGFFVPEMPEFLRALDRGERREPTSFHVFRSDLCEAPGQPWALSGFVPMPRGVRSSSDEEKRRLLAFVRSRLEQAMPGFSSGVTFERVIDPEEYERLFGVAPLPSPLVAPMHTPPLPTYDAAADVYWLGNSAGPPGDHAGAAVLSGRLAAEHAITRFQRSPETRDESLKELARSSH